LFWVFSAWLLPWLALNSRSCLVTNALIVLVAFNLDILSPVILSLDLDLILVFFHFIFKINREILKHENNKPHPNSLTL
jgi:hypothetical protein